jgi:MoaA/NifB/PqqE/SkfB family radical SAM enzyme
MDQAQARRAIDRIVALGGQTLKITGGEPMVREDLTALIHRASRAGLEVEMITNGTLLTEPFLDDVGNCLSHVSVSIDGFHKAHNALRGAGTFELAVAALDRLTARSMTVSASITVSALNFHELFQLVKFLESHRVVNFHICDLNMVGRARNNRRVLGLEWNDESRRRLFEILEKAFGCTAGNAITDTACNVEPSTVCLGANGGVYACTEIMLVNPTGRIGMIHDPDIEEQVQAYYAGVNSTEMECRYTSYVWPGVSLIMHSGRGCPLTKGGV